MPRSTTTNTTLGGDRGTRKGKGKERREGDKGGRGKQRRKGEEKGRGGRGGRERREEEGKRGGRERREGEEGEGLYLSNDAHLPCSSKRTSLKPILGRW